MATILTSVSLFGLFDPLPLAGFPPGKIEVETSRENFVFVFVKTEAGIRKFTVKEESGKWVPSIEITKP